MNTENDVAAGGSQDNTEPKSGVMGKVLGVVGLLVLVGGILGAMKYNAWQAEKPDMDFILENREFVTTSPDAIIALGEPITVAESPTKTISDNNGAKTITVTVDVSGPNASGVYTYKGTREGDELAWQRTEIFLTVDGQRIELDPEAFFNIEIDDGS